MLENAAILRHGSGDDLRRKNMVWKRPQTARYSAPFDFLNRSSVEARSSMSPNESQAAIAMPHLPPNAGAIMSSTSSSSTANSGQAKLQFILDSNLGLPTDESPVRIEYVL